MKKAPVIAIAPDSFKGAISAIASASTDTMMSSDTVHLATRPQHEATVAQNTLVQTLTVE